MKVKYILVDKPGDIEVTVKGYQKDPALESIKTFFDHQTGLVIGQKDGRKYRIQYTDIYYIEIQEEKTILFTEADSYFCPLRLYEIVAWGNPFIRISKSVIINVMKLKSFKPLLNSKLEATLTNGDRVEVSRMYIQELKKIIGGQK